MSEKSERWNRRLLTPEQDAYLRRIHHCARRTFAETTARFNRDWGTRLKVSQITRYCQFHGIVSGITGSVRGNKGSFKKGHVPWTADVAGTGVLGPNAGSFKKGDEPPNKAPVGTIRERWKHGRLERLVIKIAEQSPHPSQGKTGHWVSLAPRVWEQAGNPKPPPGHVLFLRDGDPRNCTIENILMVHRNVLNLLNQKGYRDLPPALRKTALVLAMLEHKAKINVRKRRSTA